ncbi:MAG: D-alanine--D-alanine ligase [Deltaproteobacteria bacterium]|nr:D-alanine--D-alanine ligase [Deltaproteobacteria bacterium]MBN2688011.1 D-alanine--D-alanine ligase [Deltaproteobacteria bacterium]
MKIGITYDLRDDYRAAGFSDEETAEFDRADTIQAIVDVLRKLGYDVDCVGNYEHVMRRLLAGDRWDLVFNIAEGLRGFGREGLVPSLLDAYGIPYTFSDPLVLSLTLHKAMAKRVVRDLGIPTPDFFVVDREKNEINGSFPFPLFAKPVAEGTSKGINAASRILNARQLTDVCNRLLHQFKQPVLVEKYLPGREFTVGIVGSGRQARVVGVMEVILKENAEDSVYSYTNKERYKELVEYQIADDITAHRTEKLALAVWHGLGCKDAGRVDFRVDKKGLPNFMEVNPLAGLHPEHSDLCIIATLVGMSYQELLESILASTIERYPVLKSLSRVAHG